MSSTTHLLSRLWLLASLLLALSLAACRGSTPTPPPTPTPRPTATPAPQRVLEGSLFTIRLDDTLLATEEIHTRETADQLVVFSEMRWFGEYPMTQRRTVLLSETLTPLRYDVEQSVFGVRSIWVGERKGDRLDCLSNNMEWYAPVLIEGIEPAPAVMLEAAPSALPFALLALRYTDESRGDEETLMLHSVDVMEDYVISRPLTVTPALEREGAIIGTQALAVEIEGGINPRATMWVRPKSRTLFGVEIRDYRGGFWQQLRQPALRRSGTLVIQRVAELPSPEEVAAAPTTLHRQEVAFEGADGTARQGTLTLPEGDGLFPCLVIHSPGGVVPRWQGVDRFVAHGWATYAYDKRGVGESEGDYERGRIVALAADAVAAAEMLAQRPDIDAQRIAFLGLDEGGHVGALAMASSTIYSAAMLGSCATDRPLFPDLAEQRIRNLLGPFYGWDEVRLAAYRNVSVERWGEWLFEGTEELAALGRRTSFRGLRDQAGADLYAALSSSDTPVLLLHGEEDRWTPVAGARALYARLTEAGRGQIALHVLPGLGADLKASPEDAPFAPEVERIMFEWLGGIWGQ